VTQPRIFEPARPSRQLRSALGGRLRSFRTPPGAETRLEAIRKALVRGELILNEFSRWRLLEARTPAFGWTLAKAGCTAAVAEVEVQIARRESGQIPVIVADESTVEDAFLRIENDSVRAELLLAQRDQFKHPKPNPRFSVMLNAAKARGLVIHVIAAIGSQSETEDELLLEARRRGVLDRDPLLGPPTRQSNIENRFGKALVAAGLEPIPQKPVGPFFLDFAVIGTAGGLPVRLDIEVDGRRWHEDMPGHRRIEDKNRDKILRRLGWRPIRFWADEIEQNEKRCIERISTEAESSTPIGSH